MMPEGSLVCSMGSSEKRSPQDSWTVSALWRALCLKCTKAAIDHDCHNLNKILADSTPASKWPQKYQKCVWHTSDALRRAHLTDCNLCNTAGVTKIQPLNKSMLYATLHKVSHGHAKVTVRVQEFPWWPLRISSTFSLLEYLTHILHCWRKIFHEM